MDKSDETAFPFAEFDPILRRDLCSVLEAVLRELGIADGDGDGVEAADQFRGGVNVKACAIARLRSLAECGERSADRLFDETVRTVAKAVSPV